MEFKFAARTSSPASVQRSFKFASRTTSSSPVPDSSRHVREQWTRSLPLGLSRLCLTALVMRVNDGVCLSDSTHANFRYQEALDCANGPKEDAASFFCPRSFDRAIIVAQWYDLRLKTWETRVRTLPWASSGHVTTRSMSPQRLRSPMITFDLEWRKWRKGGCSFLLLSAQF